MLCGGVMGCGDGAKPAQRTPPTQRGRALKAVPGGCLQGHENLGPAGGWSPGVPLLSGFAREDAVFENMASLRELAGGVEADLRNGATFDQLPRVVILGRILPTDHALLVPQSSVLVELLPGVLVLAAPDGEWLWDEGRPRYQGYLIPRHGRLSLEFIESLLMLGSHFDR
jgi:hypothetical protein